MKTARLRQARRLFFHDLVEPRVARHNARQWARSIRSLGDKWLYAKPLQLSKREAT